MTVDIKTNFNDDYYETTSERHSPNIRCTVVDGIALYIPEMNTKWEYCSSYSADGVIINSHKRLYISLQLKKFPDPATYCYRCVVTDKNGMAVYRSKKIIVTVKGIFKPVKL